MDGESDRLPRPDVAAPDAAASPPEDGGSPDDGSWVPVCPFLSAIGPDDRLGAPLAVPDPSNRCLSSGIPSAVLGRDQAVLCLAAAHEECPRYVRATTGPAVDAPVNRARRISLPIIAAVGLLIAAAAVGGASIAIRGDLSAGAPVTGAPGSGALAASTATSPVAQAAPGAAGSPAPTTSAAASASAAASGPPARSSVAPSPSARPAGTPSASPTAPARYPGLTPCRGVPDCYVYVVKTGDTLTRIATRYGLTLAEVLARNPAISDPSHIVRGLKVRLPTPKR